MFVMMVEWQFHGFITVCIPHSSSWPRESACLSSVLKTVKSSFSDWIIFKGSKKIICFYIYVLKITFHWSTYVIRKCHSLLSVSVMWSLFLLYVFPKHSLFNVKVSQVRTFPLLIISGFCLGFSFTTWLTTQAGANTDGVKGIVHPFITYNFVDVAFSNIL